VLFDIIITIAIIIAFFIVRFFYLYKKLYIKLCYIIRFAFLGANCTFLFLRSFFDDALPLLLL